VTGNMLMALASTTVVDKSPTATDRINVSGVLGVNGTLLYSSVGGYVPQFTDTAVIASATTITGSFASVPDTVTGVLFPVVTKVTVGGTQQEVLSFQAASFLTQLTGATSDQTTLANALDALRATNYNDLAALYQAIDPLTDGPLGQALENLAPDAQRAVSGLLDMQSENYGDFLFEHLGSAGSEGAGQEVAFRFNADGLGMALANQSGTAASLPFLALGQNAASLEPARVMPAGLSDLGLSSAFLDGGVLNGDIEIGGGGGKADVDGFQIGAGVDRKNVLPGLTLGAAIGIAQSTTTLAATPSMIQIGAYEGAIFGRYDWADSWTAQGFMAFATQSIQTRRTVVVGATTFNLAGHTHGFAPTYGVLVGKTFVADNVTITPQARLRYLQSSVDGYTETGGAPAMTFSSIDTDSVLASFGAVAEVDADMGGIGLKPSARAFFVHRVGGREGLVTSAFAGAPGTLLTFPVADETQDWGELGVGLEADMTEHFGHPSSLSFRYDTTVGRDNISYGTWSGNITIHL
ncbi:MAG: autotransporter domain-containing protein, partial [Alphaproteobacteria bacterium]|nr:autotransporter domain-containing protein [Alphaproteobacteria bacterium]